MILEEKGMINKALEKLRAVETERNRDDMICEYEVDGGGEGRNGAIQAELAL